MARSMSAVASHEAREVQGVSDDCVVHAQVAALAPKSHDPERAVDSPAERVLALVDGAKPWKLLTNFLDQGVR